MGIVATAITFCLLIGTFVFLGKGRRVISPVFLFLLLWFVVLLFSTLRLYNIEPASNEAYLVILLMVMSFTLGYILYEFYKRKIAKKRLLECGGGKEGVDNGQIGFNDLRIKIYLALCVLLIIFNIIDCILVLKYVSSGTPAWQVRNWSLAPFGSSNPILDRRSFLEDVFRNVVLSPLSIIIPPITAYIVFRVKNKKFRLTCLIISLLALVTASFASGGGRLGFIYYTVCFGLAFLTLGKTKSIKKSISKKMLVLIVVAISAVVGFTVFRTGVGNVAKQTYTYFAVPPTLLTKWLPEIEKSPKTYGMTSFFGVHSYVFRTADIIGAEQIVPGLYKDSFEHILDAEKFLDVGYGIANAFVTPAYYFMIDGGYIFVCLASIFFGLVSALIFWLFLEKKNILRFAVYVLVVYGVIVSFIRIQTSIPAYILAFLYIFLMFFRFSKKDKNEEKRV